MSVLHLLGTAGEGGAETYFVELLEALKRAGVDEAAAIRANPIREARLAHDRPFLASSAFCTLSTSLSPRPDRFTSSTPSRGIAGAIRQT